MNHENTIVLVRCNNIFSKNIERKEKIQGLIAYKIKYYRLYSLILKIR